MKTSCRIVACLAVFLAAAVLFSALFVVLEADHDCDDENCSVCAQIGVCEDLLRQAGACLAADATACCSQGLEFDPPAGLSYPGEPGAQITVTGIFDSYEEQEANGMVLYLVLRDAQLL